MRIKSASEQVYDYIIEQVETGELIPGEQLSETTLINFLNISRTPIREALIKLSADGIIEKFTRKGFFVKEISRDDVLENYFIIAQLDSYAAVLAMDRLTQDNYNQMNRLIEDIDIAIENKNYQSYHHNQSAFHEIYFKKCGNKNLSELIYSLQKKYVRTTWFSQQENDAFKWLKIVNNDHKAILKAFIDHNEIELKRNILSHWVSKRKRPDDKMD